MPRSKGAGSGREPPRNRRNRYTEQVDEVSRALESEQVEVERELPTGENPSGERAEPVSGPPLPMFED